MPNLTNCNITDGSLIGCLGDTTGGVKQVWIGQYNGPSLTYTTVGVGDLTIATFSGGTSSFYLHEHRKEVAELTGSIEVNGETGGTVYEHNLTITLLGMKQSVLTRIKSLTSGYWRIIVQSNDNRYFMLGLNAGADVISGTPGLGKALTDLNGSTLVFRHREIEPMRELSAAAALQLIVNA